MNTIAIWLPCVIEGIILLAVIIWALVRTKEDKKDKKSN